MIPDLDIYRAAKLLLDRYGEVAAVRAERRVSELWDAGDAEGTAVWRQILHAVGELTRPRRDDEPVN
jgi:hypothetical protein